MMIELRNEDLPKSLFEQMEGYQPPKDFVSNGCSCAPDEYGGVDLRPACHFHDWMYHLGGCKRKRKGADQMFYRNLVRCGLSPKMAGVYYRRVRLWGVNAFNWHKGCKPVKPWCYIRLFFSRYLTW